MDIENRLYTARELSKLAGVSDAYIRRLLKTGKIKGQKVGNSWAISKGEVVHYLQSRQG